MSAHRGEEHRKAEIRTAAIRCFVRRGYAGTRLLDVAHEAGLSKGGIYFHYPSKDALFRDILDTHLAELGALWSFDPPGEGAADRGLARMIAAHLRALAYDADALALYHLLVTVTAQDIALREKFAVLLASQRAVYARVIERGVTEGVFAVADVATAATCLVATIHGMTVEASVDASGRLPVRIDACVELLIRGLRATAAAWRDGREGAPGALAPERPLAAPSAVAVPIAPASVLAERN